MIDNLTSIIPGWHTTIIPFWIIALFFLVFCSIIYFVFKIVKKMRNS